MVAEEAPIYPVPSDDPEMEAAAAKARQTFRFFWREVSWERRRIIPGLELAAVKATFADPPELRAQNPDGLEVEHMWLMDVDFDGRQISGTLINSPHSLQSVSEGDHVTITAKQLYDWMYVCEGNVYGGFTVDVMRSRMDKGEIKQHDQAWGFDFGPVGIVNLVPPEWIGEKVPAKKGLRFRLTAPPPPKPQDYNKVAAAEHPMSVNMRPSLEEAIGENPAMLHETDENGFTFLHQLALAGSLDGVDVCLKHGADPNQKAANGMTALALAKCLGWKKVMARLEQA